MAKLMYSASASLDGYVEDEHGRFGWAKPDEDVHVSYRVTAPTAAAPCGVSIHITDEARSQAEGTPC